MVTTPHIPMILVLFKSGQIWLSNKCIYQAFCITLIISYIYCTLLIAISVSDPEFINKRCSEFGTQAHACLNCAGITCFFFHFTCSQTMFSITRDTHIAIKVPKSPATAMILMAAYIGAEIDEPSHSRDVNGCLC